MSRAPSRARCWVFALAAACGPEQGPNDSAGDDEAGDDTTASDDGGPSTSPVDSSNGTANDGASTAEATNGSDDASDGPVSACEADPASGCLAYCMLANECFGVNEPCESTCEREVGQSGPACAQATCEFYACLGASDCAALEGGPPACIPLEEALEDTCGSDGGKCFVGASATGKCQYSCGGIPNQLMACEANTCTCLEDDVQVGMCEIQDACDRLAMLDDHAARCCGF